jgi:hypothetical protein
MSVSIALSAEALRASRRRARIAGAAAALALALPGLAQATNYFTATASSDTSFTMNDVLFKGFSFGYYDVRFSGGCFAQCITATGANGTPLGAFNFSMSGSPWSYLIDPVFDPTTTTVAVAPGGNYEHFEGYGGVNMLGGVFGNGPALLGGGPNFSAFSIYADPGASTATVEFDLDQFAKSDVIALPSGPLYLQITGSTANPVSLYNLTPDRVHPLYTFTTPMTFDFTVTLSDTPFSRVIGGGGGAPEPATWGLMLLGFAGAGIALRRGRRAGLALQG